MIALALFAVSFAAPIHGPHPVGFETFLVTDATRPIDGKPRPIQVSFWYPAKDGEQGKHLTYRDYVALAASQRGTAAPPQITASVEEHAAFLRRAGLEPQDMKRWLEQPMLAVQGAAALAGPRALVLFAQGNFNDASDEADLCELLASRGFAVATSPSPTRLTGPMKSEADIAPAAEDQALDLAAVARAVRTHPAMSGGSLGKPALVAHSFGARSALLYAMREGASALVSLDGGIGVKVGQAELARSRFFAATRARLPILHLYEELDAFMVKDFALIESLSRSDRWLAHVAHLHHIHFTFLGDAVARFPALGLATHADAQTADAHAAVARITVEFVELALKKGGPRPDAVTAALQAAAPFIAVTKLLPASR